MRFSTRTARKPPASCFTSTGGASASASSILMRWRKPRWRRSSISPGATSTRCSSPWRKSSRMLSRNHEQTLHRALAFASARRHEYATLEHLLLALTEDQEGLSVLRACGLDLERLRRELVEYLDTELETLAVNRGEDPKPTAGFQRVLQRAAIHVQSSGRQEVTGANVLVALFSERESHAVFFLQEQEMTRLDAVNYI